eukprot:NODE_989_length_1722_cov_123.702194_g928_i0.p1 GENE.NODE_989_length_1722_cov_123.702194_g928_i0~~NODE_989_length_1722_cov_123.702194_g928_i0.p1  ORF type:complete len:507 (+),score=49.28 NODE_989_length_1722_cov_123.702194_g928_i0:57-1577(+)
MLWIFLSLLHLVACLPTKGRLLAKTTSTGFLDNSSNSAPIEWDMNLRRILEGETRHGYQVTIADRARTYMLLPFFSSTICMTVPAPPSISDMLNFIPEEGRQTHQHVVIDGQPATIYGGRSLQVLQQIEEEMFLVLNGTWEGRLFDNGMPISNKKWSNLAVLTRSGLYPPPPPLDGDAVQTSTTTWTILPTSPPSLLNPPNPSVQECFPLIPDRSKSLRGLSKPSEFASALQSNTIKTWTAQKPTMTHSEFMSRLGTKLPPWTGPFQPKPSSVATQVNLPLSFDARQQWANCTSIQTIRNQAKCGSCWAHSAAEAFSDRLCVAHGTNQIMSPQYQMDCNTDAGGCEGAAPDQGWKGLQNFGTVTERCIPYKAAQSDHCPTRCVDGSPLKRQYAYYTYAASRLDTPQQLQQELMKYGPVSVALYVFSDLMGYKSGVYHRTPGAKLMGGHAVKLVGWGVSEEGVPYWTIANSWGAEWGEKGFFRIRRGVNECGVEAFAAAGRVDPHSV